MNRLCFALLLAVPVAAFADNTGFVLSPIAAFANPDAIASNIRAECKLPEYQVEVFRRELEAQGIAVKLAEQDVVPAAGRFLQVRIQYAVSTGNAFIGHRKHVTTSVKLFDDGKEVAGSTHARDSMGGFGAGFKGSCAVLERCADTLAKDMTAWLKREMAKAPVQPAPAAAAPVEPAAPAAAPAPAENAPAGTPQ